MDPWTRLLLQPPVQLQCFNCSRSNAENVEPKSFQKPAEVQKKDGRSLTLYF